MYYLFQLQDFGFLFPQSGMEPGPPAVEAQSPSHWIIREFSKSIKKKIHNSPNLFHSNQTSEFILSFLFPHLASQFPSGLYACVCVCVCVLVAQSCPTLCSPVDCSPTGSFVHRFLQAKILEWVAISSSKGSSQPRDQTQVSCIAGRFFIIWAKREVHIYLSIYLSIHIHTMIYRYINISIISLFEFLDERIWGQCPELTRHPPSPTLVILFFSTANSKSCSFMLFHLIWWW